MTPRLIGPSAYVEFVEQVRPLIEPFGGTYLVRGGSYVVLEGRWQTGRLVFL